MLPIALFVALASPSLSPQVPAVEGERIPSLCEAAWKGDLPAARRAIERGGDLEAEWQFQTPLMWASKMGHAEVLELLLGAGARINTTCGREDWTALRWAAASGNAAILERLLDAGASLEIGEDSWYGSLAHLSARNRDPRMVELLARAGASIDRDSEKLGGTPLHVAAYAGNSAVVAALLAGGARVDARGKLERTPLHLAAYAGHLDVVQVLLEHGADRECLDALGRTPLHLAAEAGNADVLEGLGWDAKAEDWSQSLVRPDLHGWTPLHAAAAFGQERSLQALHGQGMESTTRQGRTALHLACWSGQTDAVEWLLRQGASPLARDERGRLPRDLLGIGVPERTALKLGGTRSAPDPDAPDIQELVNGSSGSPSIRLLQAAGYTMEPRSGVLLVVWPDGLMLFAPDRERPGEDLRVARMAPSALEDTLVSCEELGVFDLPDWSQVAMHSSSWRLTLQKGEARRQLEWDGVPQNRWDWYPSFSQRTYENAWTRILAALESLIPSESLPLTEVIQGHALRGILCKDR